MAKDDDKLDSSISDTARHRELVDIIFPKYTHYNPVQSALIPMLQDIQAEVGYLPREALNRVADLLHLPPSQVYGVATFYHQFRLRSRGKHMITVCRGTACHVKESLEVYTYLNQQLGIKPPQDTSPDSLFTVQQVRCLGACGLAPVIKVDEIVYGRVNNAKIREILRAAKKGGKQE